MSNVKIQSSTSYRDYLVRSLSDPQRIAGYLEVTLEHEPEDPIPDLLRLVLSDVVAAREKIDELSPQGKELFDRLDRILIETKAVEIYGLIDLLDELGFRLAVIPKEQQDEDTDDDSKIEVG
jgi:DNA-binding phage protein